MHLIVDGRMATGDDAPLTTELEEWLERYPATIGMTVIAGPVVRADTHMVTGLVVIAESHISVHVERMTGVAHVDVFSCKPFDHQVVQATVVRKFRLHDVTARAFVRHGDLLADPIGARRAIDAGAERLDPSQNAPVRGMLPTP